jgi:CRP/FNR family cyclic AMP-dependent transcriptional regulator
MAVLFRDIVREAEFQRVAGCEIKTYQAGEVIVQEDAPGNEIYLILSGTAEVFAAVDHLGTPGRTAGIAKLHENEVIGELSLFDNQPRTASVIASSPCEIAVMDGPSLEVFMDANPDKGYWILKDIFAQVIKRMRQTTIRSNAITALYLNDFSG